MGRALVVLSLLIAACSGSPPAATPPAQATIDPGFVTHTEFGAEWPFTVSAGTLHCYDDPLNERLYVTFSHEAEPGVEYAINGSARDFGYPELDKAMMPALPNRAGLTPLIERGLELCP
jgi:hypothetical protein